MTLQKYIEESGATQAACAALLSISPGYLSDLLSGKRRPSLELATRIERLTNGAVLAGSWVPMPPDEIGAEANSKGRAA